MIIYALEESQMDWVYALRLLNMLLAAGVVGLCFYKASWTHLRTARDARVAGLGFIAASIAYGSGQLRHQPFEWRVLGFTIGLSLCLYGMSRIAMGEVDNNTG